MYCNNEKSEPICYQCLGLFKLLDIDLELSNEKGKEKSRRKKGSDISEIA